MRRKHKERTKKPVGVHALLFSTSLYSRRAEGPEEDGTPLLATVRPTLPRSVLLFVKAVAIRPGKNKSHLDSCVHPSLCERFSGLMVTLNDS